MVSIMHVKYDTTSPVQILPWRRPKSPSRLSISKLSANHSSFNFGEGEGRGMVGSNMQDADRMQIRLSGTALLVPNPHCLHFGNMFDLLLPSHVY